MIHIGLLSDDQALQLLLSSALGREFRVVLEPIDNDTEERLAGSGYDVLILDLRSGQDALNERLGWTSRSIASRVPLVVMADDDLRSRAMDLVRMGAFSYCRRPPSIRELKSMLVRAHENWSRKRVIQSSHQRPGTISGCDRLIGSSPQMQRVYQLINRVATVRASVLISGPSGSGKELIARAIHNLGARSDRPFVAVSCSAIPESLIEAELFGHEKGAFTGTAGAREGYFESVQDGTLFRDEIGVLSLFTQVKLLRVLQQLEFNRLGSSRSIPLRARLVFATHQDLAKLVMEGKFRQDLYYRINVMRIDVPALADHPEDIAQIATHYLKHYSGLFKKPIDGIAPEAIARLQRYTWPGNVRELENVIQRAIILASGDRIRSEDIPLHDETDHRVDIGDYIPTGSFEDQIRDYKIKLAMDAVKVNNGNKTLAARSLGISRAYLHRLIRTAEHEPVYTAESLQSGSSSATVSVIN